MGLSVAMCALGDSQNVTRRMQVRRELEEAQAEAAGISVSSQESMSEYVQLRKERLYFFLRNVNVNVAVLIPAPRAVRLAPTS